MKKKFKDPRDVYLQLAAGVFAAIGVVTFPFSVAAVVIRWEAKSGIEAAGETALRIVFFSAPLSLIISSVGIFFSKNWGYVCGFATAMGLCVLLLYYGLAYWFEDVTVAGFSLIGAWFFYDVCSQLIKKRKELAAAPKGFTLEMS